MEYKARSAKARALDLGSVIRSLVGVQDRHDPHLWRLAGNTISVDGPRYRDLTRGHEGAGAVELLQHATGCDYREAIAYLAYKGGPEIAAIAASDHTARDAMRYAERVKDTPIDLIPIALAPMRAQAQERDDRDDWGR